MIFKRYSSPFIFLDQLLETDRFIEGVDFLINQVEEEKWWNLYLATLPLNEKSFEDWKKECTKGSTIHNSSITSKQDTEQTIKKSQEILSGFKPPQ